MERELVLPSPHGILQEAQEGDDNVRPAEAPPASEGARSPFIEGTKIQFAWDSTSLGALKKCPRYYQYKLLEGWQRHEESIHLRWGQEFHSALEDYDRSRAAGITHDDSVHDTVRALIERIEDWDPEPNTKSEEFKTKPNLIRSVVWYLDHYNPDPAQTLILANGKPAVELSFQFELDEGRYPENEAQLAMVGGDPNKRIPWLLCGHLDRVVTFADNLYVMDRKTTSTAPGSFYFAQFEPNNQMSLYTLASQIILDSPIRGVIIDVVQVGADFSRFTRGFTYRSSDQLEEWVEHTKSWLRYAERLAVDGFWPMNDTACDKFGGCEFRGICSKSPGARQKFLESAFERREPWNPLKPR